MNNPNVLLPEPTGAGERRMCFICHRTRFYREGFLICPECGDRESEDENKPEPHLTADNVQTWLVQPGNRVEDDPDLPQGVTVVREDDLNDQARNARAPKRSIYNWDRQFLR